MMEKVLDISMEIQKFSPTDTVKILSLSTSFKSACDEKGVHQEAEMWILN